MISFFRRYLSGDSDFYSDIAPSHSRQSLCTATIPDTVVSLCCKDPGCRARVGQARRRNGSRLKVNAWYTPQRSVKNYGVLHVKICESAIFAALLQKGYEFMSAPRCNWIHQAWSPRVFQRFPPTHVYTVGFGIHV